MYNKNLVPNIMQKTNSGAIKSGSEFHTIPEIKKAP